MIVNYIFLFVDVVQHLRTFLHLKSKVPLFIFLIPILISLIELIIFFVHQLVIKVLLCHFLPEPHRCLRLLRFLLLLPLEVLPNLSLSSTCLFLIKKYVIYLKLCPNKLALTSSLFDHCPPKASFEESSNHEAVISWCYVGL